jgi:outer membrane immunogenic protein
MNKLLASASILILGSVAASAADLPIKAAPTVAPIPVFSWTGCYIGAHAGGGTMRDSFTFDNDNGSRGSNGTGAIAGGQTGCNYQDGNAVFGLEGEGYWSGLKTTGGADFSALGEGVDRFTAVVKNRDDFSIAARVGLAFDRTLIYGKAGWVWGNFTFSLVDQCCGTNPIPFVTTGSKTLDGLLLGAGIEHAFTQNWTVKLEYNFLDFGTKGVTFVQCLVTCNLPVTVSEHASKQIFKVGFNYLFPVGGAPAVAKY